MKKWMAKWKVDGGLGWAIQGDVPVHPIATSSSFAINGHPEEMCCVD
jgi:hypothetical protein